MRDPCFRFGGPFYFEKRQPEIKRKFDLTFDLKAPDPTDKADSLSPEDFSLFRDDGHFIDAGI